MQKDRNNGGVRISRMWYPNLQKQHKLAPRDGQVSEFILKS